MIDCIYPWNIARKTTYHHYTTLISGSPTLCSWMYKSEEAKEVSEYFIGISNWDYSVSSALYCLSHLHQQGRPAARLASLGHLEAMVPCPPTSLQINYTTPNQSAHTHTQCTQPPVSTLHTSKQTFSSI